MSNVEWSTRDVLVYLVCGLFLGFIFGTQFAAQWPPKFSQPHVAVYTEEGVTYMPLSHVRMNKAPREKLLKEWKEQQ